ncbi:MAG TPA: thiol:disulfide interchange protein DsbA/DsbL [Steroidobacteraceae bacterium]|jgi:thiol:disulfide interchange protein DsbA|nr:thiol:disulfide interchange protein DsbA/DsbL [Steroidobacteraceae bacterium]
MRIRVLAIAALLALSACARQAPPAPAPAPSAAADPQAAAPPPAATAPPAEARSAQSETEQATASQESGDGENAGQARSDASLERIAGSAPSASLPAGKWQAGVNYDPVVPAQPTSVAPGKVEVMEVLWLACPHCYALEPRVRSWLKTKPAYVEFVRVPVIWQQVHRAHARLYYTLEALGRDDLVTKAFDTIHQDLENHQPPLVGNSDEETYRLQQQFAVQNGISADDFSKAYNSFSVSSNLQRAEEITQRYHVQGVPFFVVNGKYGTDVQKAGSEAKLIELINDLAASEHAH